MTDRRTWLQFALALASPLLSWPAPTMAQNLAEADARAVRAVVQAQLDAFAADDAERAFSYASTAIRAQFGNAARFMAMVRSAYPMVVQPAGVTFFSPQLAPPAVRLQVQLRDAAGRLWLATYTLATHGSGNWRIEGCTVVPDTEKTTT